MLAYNHFGVRQLWGGEVKAVRFDLSKLRGQEVEKRRLTGVGRNGAFCEPSMEPKHAARQLIAKTPPPVLSHSAPPP
eukprot:8870432-Alexandrium_andersonii.AAC.1